jgi:hypothetical protein
MQGHKPNQVNLGCSVCHNQIARLNVNPNKQGDERYSLDTTFYKTNEGECKP